MITITVTTPDVTIAVTTITITAASIKITKIINGFLSGTETSD
jgi:hypothetical protein